MINQRLKISLFGLRLGVFMVMLFWTLDKFVRPDHAVAVFEGFYAIPGLGEVIMKGLGGLELILIAGFLIGFKKRFTYGAILLLHGISTFSSYKQYLAPFEKVNLLFFAAWPMFAACIALYLLRDEDTMFTVKRVV
ncbi:MAG: hypothetical protein AB7H97_18530 [Pseudobdellovibrionaceae bacterium]